MFFVSFDSKVGIWKQPQADSQQRLGTDWGQGLSSVISEVPPKTPRPDVTCGMTPVCFPCCGLRVVGERLC